MRNLLLPSLPPTFEHPIVAWVVFLSFLPVALIEIPVMIYGLRKVAEGKSKNTPNIVLLGNGVFVSFPIVYALPNLFLTSVQLVWLGILIAATSLLRFGASILFLAVD